MDEVKINMMCGKRNFGKGWYHVDQADFPHILDRDIYLHSFPNSSVDLIYCSHGIAYFDREDIVPLLKAWKRVLKKGGILRLATPDWDVLRKMDVPMLGPLYGKMNCPPIYHRTIYTFDSLKRLLVDNGFHYPVRYDHMLTEHAEHDDHSAAYHKGKLISLNMEATA